MVDTFRAFRKKTKTKRNKKNVTGNNQILRPFDIEKICFQMKHQKKDNFTTLYRLLKKHPLDNKKITTALLSRSTENEIKSLLVNYQNLNLKEWSFIQDTLSHCYIKRFTKI